MFLNIGQKFFKRDNDNNITDLYRVTSKKSFDYYRVTTVLGEKKDIIYRNELKEGFEVPETHCKLFIELATLSDGSKDIVISIFTPFESFPYPYYIGRIGYNYTSSYSGWSICKYQFNNADEYRQSYDLMMNDIISKDYVYSIDLYLNDSEDVITSFIRLDQKISREFVNWADKLEFKYDNINKAISLILQRLEFLYWFHYCFKVFKVLFKVEPGKKNLPPGDLFALEAITKERFIDYIIVEYYHDINLSKVQGNFFFISDSEDRVFLVKYISSRDIPGVLTL